VPRILRRGDYDDYPRRSGVNISVGTGDLGGSQWEGITGQPRWAAVDNCDSRTDRDYAERVSPSINLKLASIARDSLVRGGREVVF
jgi:hypothetical protein